MLKGKKGVSVMIGYVLLVVIAVGISILAFAYLKLYLPKDEPQCFEDVLLTLESVDCSGGRISLTLENRGLFNINSAFIRIGDPGRIFRELLGGGATLFIESTDGVLSPGESWSNSFVYNGTGTKELEIEPVLYIDGKAALCEEAVISRNINCIPP